MMRTCKHGLILSLVFMLAVLAACQDSDEKTDANQQGDKPVTIKMLYNWNGSTGPDNMLDTPVGKKIAKKTGIKLDVDHTEGDENEKANTIFATGSTPDLYVGPAWGNSSTSQTLLKAANEGQLHDLTKYIEKYPNVAHLVKKENMSPTQYENIIKRQKGGQYILIQGHAHKNEDFKNWLYGLYVNKDYADKVDIDPQSVHTPDDLYDYLKKLKSLGLKANGKTVFPLGANGGGWPLDIMSEMFIPKAGAASWMIDDNGNAKLNMMTEEYQDYILYMQKLMSEGLLDPEAYSQTDSVAKEKFAQERDAVIPNQFDGLWTEEHKADLGNKYIPLGPLNDWKGDPYRTEVTEDAGNAIAIPKSASEEKVEAIMSAINDLQNKDGWILTHYGIEGEHYDKEDNGELKAKKKWVEKQEEDSDTLKNEGIGVDEYTVFSGDDRANSLAGGPFGYQYNKENKTREKFEDIMTPDEIKPIKGVDPALVVQNSEHYDELDAVFDTLGDSVEEAINAGSKDKALIIIEKTRNALKNAGVEQVAEEISKQAKNGTEFLRYETSN